MVLLIVDDSEIFRGRLIEILSQQLEIKQYLEADSILSAKKIIKDITPDLIITDIRMPGGNGFELLQWLKLNNHKADVAVVTNFPETEYKAEALKLGANWFFDKSNEIQKLVNIIKTTTKK